MGCNSGKTSAPTIGKTSAPMTCAQSSTTLDSPASTLLASGMQSPGKKVSIADVGVAESLDVDVKIALKCKSTCLDEGPLLNAQHPMTPLSHPMTPMSLPMSPQDFREVSESTPFQMGLAEEHVWTEVSTSCCASQRFFGPKVLDTLVPEFMTIETERNTELTPASREKAAIQRAMHEEAVEVEDAEDYAMAMFPSTWAGYGPQTCCWYR